MKIPDLEPRHLKLKPSFSRLDTFSNCERKYLYDLLYPQPPSAAMVNGSQVHAQLEALVMGKELDEEVLPQAAAGMDAWKKLGGTALETEKEITAVRDLPFTGWIDVLAEDFVVDWKTCKNLNYAKDQYEAYASLQLQIYCLATNYNRAAFVYLPKTGGYRIREITFLQEDLEIAYKRLSLLIPAVRSRWIAAGATPDGKGIKQPEKLDLSPFSVAKSDYKFCDPRWCNHWNRCLGAT